MNESKEDSAPKIQIPLTPEEVRVLLGFEPTLLPRHIAMIPDGNGRWAIQRGLSRIMGHREGIKSVRRTVRECRRLGIGYLTIYAFSMENWNRPQPEVEALWGLLKTYIRQELPELKANGIRLKVIGRVDMMAKDVQAEIHNSIQQTQGNSDLVLTIALSYSGRDELVCATRKIGEQIASGSLRPDDVTEELFANSLETSDLPDPDLLIRTSGEMRLSNYLLWQLAYSEICVTDTLWPDFGVTSFHDALRDFARRERRFGRTSEQLG